MIIKKLQLAPPYSREDNRENLKIELDVEFADHIEALNFFIQLNRLVNSNQKETKPNG